jgi:serine/threonine-protein kinase RsbW
MQTSNLFVMVIRMERSLRAAHADLRAAAGSVLDPAEPTAVLLPGGLQFIPDSDGPAGIVADVAARLVPGSLIAISHLTADFTPGPAAVAAYNPRAAGAVSPRGEAEVTALFGGHQLQYPGVGPVSRWRPSCRLPPGGRSDVYGGSQPCRLLAGAGDPVAPAWPVCQRRRGHREDPPGSSPARRAARPARRANQSHDHWWYSMPENNWQRVFPGEESQLAVLREWLAGLLPASPQRDDLVVVASELGTNAIRHTASGVGGGQFIVEVTWHAAAVRVAVTDCGAPAGPRIINDPLSEHGLGLRVVQGMSALMGVTGNPGGRQVWADIPRDKAATAEPASPRAVDESIQAGLADLTSRFAGIPVWFGQTTRQWWALTRGQLVTASTVPGLAELLSQEQLSPARHAVPGTGR